MKDFTREELHVATTLELMLQEFLVGFNKLLLS